jgi:hypothetical protein
MYVPYTLEYLLIEEKVNNYEEEVNKSKIKLDYNMKLIKKQLSIITDKDMEIKNKNSENNDLSNEILLIVI